MVYFTSKIIDKSGVPKFYVNRYYSSSAFFTDNIAFTNGMIMFSLKKNNMDLSIMPWRNMVKKTTIEWNGVYSFTSFFNSEVVAKWGTATIFQFG